MNLSTPVPPGGSAQGISRGIADQARTIQQIEAKALLKLREPSLHPFVEGALQEMILDRHQGE